MEILDNKRARKPVNYALLEDSDDDFSEFSPPVKKKKDEKSKLSKPDEAVNGHSSDSSKSTSISNLNLCHSSDTTNEKSGDKEKVDKDREREKNSDKDKYDKDKDREKREGRDKDKDKYRDKEKKDGKENDRHKDKEKNRVKERRDDKDRDRHEKQKDKDRENRSKSHDKDSDRHKNKDKHRDRERDKHSDKENKNSSQGDRHTHKKDKKHDKREKEEERKEKDKKKVFDDDDDFKDGFSSPKSSSRPLTSTQKSPGRGTPKARLTLEERMFQRELEAALAISKLETKSGLNDDKVSQPGTAEGQSNAKENTSCNPVDANEIPSNEIPDQNKDGLTCKDTVNNQLESAKEEVPVERSGAPQSVLVNSESADKNEKSSSAKTVEKIEPGKPEKVCDLIKDLDDPEPSTSTGLTRKRQRKKVVFFEESDSDSFDGFEGSELSEESDFSPSPVKRKEKPVKPAKASKPSKSPRTTTKEPSASKSPKQSSSRTKTESTKSPVQSASKTKISTGSSASTKENNAPVVNKSTPAARSNSVGTSHSPAALSKPARQSSVSSKTAVSPATNCATRIGMVKVPFRSPVIQASGGSTPNYVPQSPNNLGKIGVRLGLSRSNIKPLHPGVTGK